MSPLSPLYLLGSSLKSARGTLCKFREKSRNLHRVHGVLQTVRAVRAVRAREKYNKYYFFIARTARPARTVSFFSADLARIPENLEICTESRALFQRSRPLIYSSQQCVKEHATVKHGGDIKGGANIAFVVCLCRAP